MKGCNGDAVLTYRLEIGIRRFHETGAIAADGKKPSSPAVFFFLHGIPIDPLAHPSDPIPARGLLLRWDVDVQEGVAGKTPLQDVTSQAGSKGGCMIEDKILPPYKGNGKGRNSQNRGLDGRGNGTRIANIFPQVFPFIDSRGDQMDRLREEFFHSQEDTIAWGPIEGKPLGAHPRYRLDP